MTLTDTNLYGALVVMGYVKKHGMSNGGYQWTETGLHKGSYWLTSITIDQSALLMTVTS